ncbi:unnamed protein product [Rotaria socialis]|uniref:Uncharacterized protein n=1 Tax=Rotaria socialis TaxID=392032 RepID=A0A817VUM9_9BILA|nr:unnamed protein product [Rotaria socialis]CAF3318945.1 unnamed protein product [Rotaria socialis]CAF3335674.1 unnamed protein product [Rotaria socialis]CAF3346972.1 unnamed protein product [Rotaria socialis]CAF3362439.1 unnamed protein product [Rotaria socialis]
MINHSIHNNLCLLILLPANDAARIYCNTIESSSLCRIQMNSDSIQKGLIYRSMKQQSSPMKINQNIDLVKSEYDLDSSILKNLTIKNENNNNSSRNLIKQRRVKINKKFLSSSSSSQITNANIPHTFSLWYNHKKKNSAEGQD